MRFALLLRGREAVLFLGQVYVVHTVEVGGSLRLREELELALVVVVSRLFAR